MGRLTILDRPMTATERQRRYRARKREGGWSKPLQNKTLARMLGVSTRTIFYEQAVERYKLIDWPPDLRVGSAFIADVCRHADADLQAEMLELIKTKGKREAK